MFGFRRNLTATVLLFVTIGLTLTAWFFVRRNFQMHAEARYRAFSQQIQDAVQYRMQTYVNALIQTRGLFTGSIDVTREEFASYVHSVNLRKYYPGVQGIGVAKRIPLRRLRGHVHALRAEGFKKYDVWPAGKRAEYFPILFLEPFDQVNQRAFGYDMYSEPARRDAMVAAAMSGEPTMSRKVQLVQEDADSEARPGFLIYVPIYKRGLPLRTEKERLAALMGFVYSPFRMWDLMSAILEGTSGTQDLLGIAIYDGESTNVEDALYLPERWLGESAFSETRVMTIGGHKWTIETRALRAFEIRSAQSVPILVLVGGLLISFLLFRMVWVDQKHAEAERALLVQEQIARQEAEKAVRLRNDFLSIASHELKTPLTALQAQVQLLRLGMDQKKNFPLERQSKILESTLVQVSRMVRLVNDLLDVSRIAAGKLELELAATDLGELVRDVVERLRLQAEAAECAIDVSEVGSATGRWDKFRLEQVVVNLVSNAIKYGRGKPIALSVRADDERAVLVVRDHGIGIAPENHERVFRAFERAASSRNYSGLGLGLYIIKQIVDAHSGKISLASELGVGSRFTVELPRHLAAAAADTELERNFRKSS